MEEREIDIATQAFGQVVYNQSVVPLTAWFHQNDLTPITISNDVMVEKKKYYNIRLLISIRPEKGDTITNVLLLGTFHKPKNTIIGGFTGIEIGSVEDFSVPRGVYFIKKPMNPDKTEVMGNEGDSATTSTVNPLQTLLELEIERGKKSKMISILNKYPWTRYLLATPRGSKTILTVGMTNELLKTKWKGSTEPEPGQKPLSLELSFLPDYSLLTKSMDILAQLRSISKSVSVPHDVNSGILTFINNQTDKPSNDLLREGYSLPMHLAMCLERASETALPLDTFDAYKIPSESEREKYLGQLEGKEPRKFGPRAFECIHCKAVYKYHSKEVRSDGTVTCTNCHKQFPVASDSLD
ncbi:MAG: hypothetical protein RTU63_11820 [Candidatus Thorarchaeota archaeon]